MEVWKKCSSCKTDIQYGAKYFVCSVSSCNGQRTGYVFCSHHCFERHLPGARHRDAAALEEIAPKSASQQAQGVRRIVPSQTAAKPVGNAMNVPREILVVVSKMKDYIKLRADMNTSGDVAEILSEMIRIQCDLAVDNARAEGRKTVMARDFKR